MLKSLASSLDKLSSGFPTRLYLNHPVQLQRLARKWKVRYDTLPRRQVSSRRGPNNHLDMTKTRTSTLNLGTDTVFLRAVGF